MSTASPLELHAPAEPPRATAAARVKRVAVDPYERLVAESPQGSLYCHRWWLDAVAPNSYRILTVQRGNSLLAAWPIVTRENGQRTDATMPPMTQKLGILFAPTRAKYSEMLSNQHEMTDELIEQLPPGGAFYHQFHESFANWLPFYWRGFQQTTRYTYLLKNIKEHERLRTEMRTHGRRLIGKAVRNGLTIRDDLEFEQLLDLNDRVFERQSMDTPVSHDLLRRMDAACRQHAGRKIFPAFDRRGRLHAAAYIVWDQNTAYYLLAGSDPALRASGALYLAFWEAIRFASTIVNTFDCEGTMLQGVEYVFRCMGARQQPYFAISKPAPAMPRRGLRGWLGRTLRGAARRILPA
jgi:hypothetical protein